MTTTSEQERLLIGETWVRAAAGTVRDVLDPASGEVIAQVADAGPADVDAAVAQARAVFDEGTWARLPGGQRASCRSVSRVRQPAAGSARDE